MIPTDVCEISLRHNIGNFVLRFSRCFDQNRKQWVFVDQDSSFSEEKEKMLNDPSGQNIFLNFFP